MPALPSEGEPKVALSDACERLPGKLPEPRINKADDFRLKWREARGIVRKLNKRHDVKNRCMRNQRERFARGG